MSNFIIKPCTHPEIVRINFDKFELAIWQDEVMENPLEDKYLVGNYYFPVDTETSIYPNYYIHSNDKNYDGLAWTAFFAQFEASEEVVRNYGTDYEDIDVKYSRVEKVEGLWVPLSVRQDKYTGLYISSRLRIEGCEIPMESSTPPEYEPTIRQDGWLFITKDVLRQFVTVDQLVNRVKEECDNFTNIFTGNIYGFSLEFHDESVIEHIGGYIGDFDKSGIYDEIEAYVPDYIEDIKLAIAQNV